MTASTDMLARARDEALTTLDAASEKLLLYYRRNDEYVGGMEHSALQERIATLRALLTREAAPQEGERELLRAGYVLAMRLMQSDLHKDGEEFAAIELFVRRYHWQAATQGNR